MRHAATHIRKYVAEAWGAFPLAFVVPTASAGGLGPLVPVLAALTLAMMVYVLGSISGAHINPAITLAQLSIGKMKLHDAMPYVAAQLIGGLLALGLATLLLPGGIPASFEESAVAAAMEALGCFFLSLGVCSAVYGRVTTGASGVVVGGSLLLGIVVSSGGSLGVLNPAVALSLKLFAASYLVAPIVGAVAAAWLYRWLSGPYASSPIEKAVRD